MRGAITSRIVRTTLDLDASVLQELRERGRREGRSMGEIASVLLAQALADSAPRPEGASLRWKAADLGLPRVDLEDKDAVRAVLDGSS
jgi:hypothetical protein